MEAFSSKNQLDMARNVHDLGSINKMREAIASGDESVLQEAAEQFEAIFVQMMLKSMRKAQDALADEDSPFNSQQVKFYRDMHDQQLATDLTAGGGMGLADIIVKQMGQSEDSYLPASVIRSDGNLNSLNRDRVVAVEQAQETVLASESKGVKSAAKDSMFDTPEDFVETLRPYAEQVAEKYGMDAKAIIAQAAVETGWGKFVIHNADGESSHNLFGIKANSKWEGEQAVVDTLEFNSGIPQKQKAAFRSYASLEEAVNDYGRFITTQPRYQQAVERASDAHSYTRELQSAGYATDPNYASKIMAVYHSDRLNGLMP
ncbi:flagellar assembly peptidoglycan hydrolase FlgJ [Alteromonas sp. KS69]|jgi:flagellar protein FlgJ|uniref:flagellar assembly peptidoglycan hydrolase FlgJ n=1 Tax=Alteromonas sp. KS69 TaxID=2109917 RepID=UPI000F876A3F|nr:flagellar assembly peptidoglycan hydrolase FlgJ [Alteromonas sp. KS69]RUP82667.1 flagellar assembly peptidoglycan hydrolase FlgJ [Alteromonas sp. KS69]|tara:strand:- start:542 stop:1492 length:951 start_codon:yes stop_codon:yes gene_type:complete